MKLSRGMVFMAAPALLSLANVAIAQQGPPMWMDVLNLMSNGSMASGNLRYLHWRKATRSGMMPSAFSASTAAGYAGFLSTFITRGMGLPDASIALRRKRLAAAVSRLAVSRKSIVCPVGIQRPIQILVLAFYLYIRLVDPIALIGRLQMRAAAFVQLRRICLHPTPNAAGVHRHPVRPPVR